MSFCVLSSFQRQSKTSESAARFTDVSPHNLKVLSPCQKTEFISVRELTNRPDVIDRGGDSTYAAQELKKLKARLHLCCLLIHLHVEVSKMEPVFSRL